MVMTEEGWPSAGDPPDLPQRATEQAQRDYYQWWQSRATQDSFSSFYFGAFDKLLSGALYNADSHFGIANLEDAKKPTPLAYTINLLIDNNDEMGEPAMASHAVIVNACDNNNLCWPLEGVVGLSELSPYQTDFTQTVDRQVVDHLIIVIDNGTPGAPAACTVSHGTLSGLSDQTHVKVVWVQDGEGKGECGIE